MRPSAEQNSFPIDCGYDARFESMRDYPKKKQLYRNHVDMEKRYEKTVRHLKYNQRLVLKDCNRKIKKLEERFAKLIIQTFRNNSRKTSGLLYSYNKWARKNNLKIEPVILKSFDGNFEAMASCAQFDRTNCETPEVVCDIPRDPKRLPSHRSVSVDNIPTQIQDERQLGSGHVTVFGIGATCNANNIDVELGIVREKTSFSLQGIRT